MSRELCKTEPEWNQLVAHFTDTSFRVQGVYHYTVEPGSRGRQKTAPFPGFIFPLHGQAQLSFNDTPYHVRAGKVIHGGADMCLDKCVLGHQQLEYISVLYEVLDREPEGFCLQDSHFSLSVGQSQRLPELLHRLCKIFNQPGALAGFQAETLFRCVLEEVFICTRNWTNSSVRALFEQVSSYIHERYMEGLTVRGLAEQNGVNENRLYYVFQKNVGMGPGDYLMTYRLNRAKELLITTDAPVNAVAKSVGYPDALYFSRAFHKQFGVAPSAWRKRFRNNP